MCIFQLEKTIHCEGNVETWLWHLMTEQQRSLALIIRDAWRAITAPEFELYNFLGSFPAQVNDMHILLYFLKSYTF